MNLVFLHGFLGEKSDFDEVIAHLPSHYRCTAIDLPVCANYLEELHAQLTSLPALVGYSLGGRIALQLADRFPESFSHVIALSAHPGIEESARQARWEIDCAWIDKLQSCPLDDFLIEWYNQPIFQHLHKKPELMQSILKKRLLQDKHRAADMLFHMSLAKQPPLKLHRKTLFVHGDKDHKFASLYDGKMLVEKIEGSGHIVHLENPMGCARTIQHFMES